MGEDERLRELATYATDDADLEARLEWLSRAREEDLEWEALSSESVFMRGDAHFLCGATLGARDALPEGLLARRVLSFTASALRLGSSCSAVIPLSSMRVAN